MDDFNYYNSENDGYRGSAESFPSGSYSSAPLRPKKKVGWRRTAALVLACAIVGTGAGVGGAALYSSLNPPAAATSGAGADSSSSTLIQEDNRPQVQTVVNTNSGQAMTPEQLYAANLPSCVGITVNTTVNIYGQISSAAASGSGFVLTQDGYIVTNYHVIEEAVDDDSVTIEVSFENGNKYDAKLVGGERDNDVAILKIEAANLTPVTLGDSSQLKVGQSVYAIGNPLGELTYSLTGGLVSALDRLITTSSTNANGQRESTTLNVLQTDCAINPGNSGGPLFDSYGRVIGITTAKYTQSSSGVNAEGLGFALPINDVKNILSDLIEHGYVTGKPYLGISVGVVSSEAQRYGIPAGAVVKSVADGSCAQKAGLQVDDIITAIDGTAIDSPSALTAALSSNYKAGDRASLTIIRNQQTLTIPVTFDEKNAQTEANNPLPDQNQNQQQQQQGQQGQYPGFYYQWPFGSMFPW